MDTNDIIESLLGRGKAKAPRAAGVEIARPAVDNADDERVRLAFDPRRHLVARYPLQGGDLLADGRGKTRHGEVAPRPGSRAVHGRGMDQEADRGARRGMPVTDVLGYRQHRLLAGEWLAQDIGEE